MNKLQTYIRTYIHITYARRPTYAHIHTCIRIYEALLKELKSIQTTQTATLAELRAENQSLRNEVKFCYKVVEGHHRFLERLDARERACNVVITGVPEKNWMDTDDDAKKIRLIFDAIGCTSEKDYTWKRIGKPSNPNQPRSQPRSELCGE